MKQVYLTGFLLFICLLVSLVIYLSVSKNETAVPGKSNTENIIEDKEEESWREAAAFEFKITKDMSLGYIPKDRLLQAAQDLKQGRFTRQNTGSRTAALAWTERGPLFDSRGPNGNPRSPGVSTAGRLDAICVDRSDPSGHTLWAGTHNGGIWKTNDISAAAPVWVPVYDMMGNLGIGSICQDPSNPDVLYAGTGDKTNGGDVRGGGIWKSTDHGNTWNLLPSTAGFWNISKIECDAMGRVYAAWNMNGGVRRSTDGGITWTNITPNGMSSRIADMELSGTGRLHIYCGFSQNSTAGCGYLYTNSPATVTSASGWQTPVTSFAVSKRTAQLAVSGNTLLAMPADDAHPDNSVTQFYRSTDGGANWSATATTPDARYWSCLDAAINPANSNQIIFGSLDCFGTTDGGNTWTQRADGFSSTTGYYVHHDYHAFIWQGNEIMIGGDGGLYLSTDNGASFFSKSAGMRSFEFYTCAVHPSDPNYFIGGTQDNGTERLTLPGLGQALHVLGGDGGYTHVDQDQPQYQFGSHVYNALRRSSDGGINWQSFDFGSSGQFINPTDYDDVNNKMYCSSSPGEYLRWENPQTGNTVTSVTVPALGGQRISSLVLSPYTQNRIFTAMENGKVFRLDNIQTSSPSATDISGTGRPASYVSCVNAGTDENNLITTYSNYGTQHVWITINGGSAWINVSGNLPDIPVRWGMFHPDDNDRAIIATDLGVWTTDDLNGAATIWTPDTGLPSVRCSMLQYQPNTRTLVVATYGRGIWTTTLPPQQPYIRFANPVFLSCTEEGLQTSGCRRYKDYTVALNIDMPPAGDATVTLQVAGGATATQGADFDFTTNGNFITPSSQLIFPSGSAASQNFTLRIYDDAAVEGPESFTFGFTISGATDALPAPAIQQYPVMIADNDTDPAAPFAFTNTIGINSHPGTFQPFRGSFQKSRTQFIYLASELTAKGFIAGPVYSIGFNVNNKQSTAPYNGLTISLKNTATASFPVAAFETGTTTVYTGNYSTVAGMNTFNCSTPFNWDGISNLLVEMCYDNAATSGDDNINGTVTTTCMATWARNNGATPGCTIPATNRTFGATTFAKPDITINGTGGKSIETVQGSTVTEYAAGNGNLYFYTNGNGNLISRLNNITASPGCVNTTVYEAGNNWQPFAGGMRSQKVIEVTPSQNPGASYTIGLYFTAAELNGLSPAQLRVAKTTAATMSAATSANTIISTTTVTPYGSGYLFTASFTGFSKFFLVNQQVALPLTLLSFSGQPVQNTVLLSWLTTAEQNTSHFEIQRSLNGAGFTAIGTVAASGNTASERNYSFTDRNPADINYYRLKMVDNDGRFLYSKVIPIKRNAGEQQLWVTNPFTNQLRIQFANPPQGDIMLKLLTSDGRTVLQKKFIMSGETSAEIEVPPIAKGVYFLAVGTDNRKYLKKLIKL